MLRGVEIESDLFNVLHEDAGRTQAQRRVGTDPVETRLRDAGSSALAIELEQLWLRGLSGTRCAALRDEVLLSLQAGESGGRIVSRAGDRCPHPAAYPVAAVSPKAAAYGVRDWDPGLRARKDPAAAGYLERGGHAPSPRAAGKARRPSPLRGRSVCGRGPAKPPSG